ncbi:MAG TPA: SDR family NAD(P)-dependent oxidoreductase [Bradyrhizobium sp.]|nr:SDR family NAD(P)-dependent oxidoreductase [Bradyrhizobium sp.]
MDFKLAGKVALVTGSSRGIGLATAKAFATEGCRVMLSARSIEQLREAENGPADDRRRGCGSRRGCRQSRSRTRADPGHRCSLWRHRHSGQQCRRGRRGRAHCRQH